MPENIPICCNARARACLLYTSTDAKLAENEDAIRQGHERMQTLSSEQSCSDSRLEAVCNKYRDSSVLTYELAHSFVQSIFIHGHENIEIVWKFKDFITKGV